MQAQVKMWGNSRGIRIPKETLQQADISLDDVLDIRVFDGMITLLKQFRHKTLEERTAEYGGALTVEGESDWRIAEGGEIW